MKEEVKSVYLKDDTSFKEIVKQEQARRHLKEQPKEKLIVAIKRWQTMQMLEELREASMPEQEYSMLVEEHGLTFPTEVCSQLGLHEGQKVKLWIIDQENIVMMAQKSK